MQEPASPVATGEWRSLLRTAWRRSIGKHAGDPGTYFKDHNDVHLRILLAQSASARSISLSLSPDQAVTSVPYSLNGGGGAVSAGRIHRPANHSWSKGAGITTGDLVAAVATGPANPSQTLILLAGDEVDIVTYSAGQPARPEYSFGEHTFAIPQTTDGWKLCRP